MRLKTEPYMMHKTILLSSLVILSGCMATQSFSSNMSHFTGQPSSQLIAEFGKPDQRIEQDGQTILVFRPVRVNIPVPTATAPMANGMGGTYVSPRPSSGYSIRANCQVAFIIKNDQVTDWYSQGRDCPIR